MVDNVFATPLLQRPLELGADVVVYSATKHIDGQGRCLGGAVLVLEEVLTDHLQIPAPDRPDAEPVQRLGDAQGPGDAAGPRQGADGDGGEDRRSPRRPARASRASSICGRADHPQADLAKQQMTGGGQLIAFEVEGGKAAAFSSRTRSDLIKISNNLGDAKSLITHPATTTHYRIGPEARAELGIGDGMLRLSVGLEAFERSGRRPRRRRSPRCVVNHNVTALTGARALRSRAAAPRLPRGE